MHLTRERGSSSTPLSGDPHSPGDVSGRSQGTAIRGARPTRRMPDSARATTDRSARRAGQSTPSGPTPATSGDETATSRSTGSPERDGEVTVDEVIAHADDL